MASAGRNRFISSLTHLARMQPVLAADSQALLRACGLQRPVCPKPTWTLSSPPAGLARPGGDRCQFFAVVGRSAQWSTLQLALELLEETPVRAVRDDLAGSGLDH